MHKGYEIFYSIGNIGNIISGTVICLVFKFHSLRTACSSTAKFLLRASHPPHVSVYFTTFIDYKLENFQTLLLEE